MFAIVVVGGKQYRVEEGREIVVDRLEVAEGATVQLRPALVSHDEGLKIGEGGSAAGKVTARVVEHLRGPKIVVVRHKPKKAFHRRTGHRSELTRLAIEKIV